VGDGARVGSNAVLLKPVPPGATAVGIPARIIDAKPDDPAEGLRPPAAFSAYGVTKGDDPVAQALKGLIDNASGTTHQVAMLWAAIEQLSASSREGPVHGCVPKDAQTTEGFDHEGLQRLVK